jgi:uncharacterized protein YecT (DUF1311 family)
MCRLRGSERPDYAGNSAMSKLIFVTAILSALICSIAVAQPNCAAFSNNKIEQEFKRAIDKSGGVTVLMRNASADAFSKYDRELNESYRAILALLPDSDKKLLVESQRLWLRHRDFEEKLLWSSSIYGDTGTSGLINVDGARMTSLKNRLCDLQITLFVLKNLK